MPTSASRRVWEGKARHYNRKKVKRAIFVAARKIADALRAAPRKAADARCVPHRERLRTRAACRTAKKTVESPCARRNTVQKYSLIPYQPR